MAECEYGILVSAYFDGELDEARTREVEGHLSSCAACAAELESLRRMSNVLSGWSAPEMPGDVLARLHEAVAGEAAAAERGVLRLARVLSGVAAAVMVAGTLWLSMSARDSGATQVVDESIQQQIVKPPTTQPMEELASAEHQQFAESILTNLGQ